MTSIFDADPLKSVPVTIHVDGETKVVGQAHLYESIDGMVHAEMDLKTDNPNDVIDLFRDGITGVSIADDDHFHTIQEPKRVKSEMDIQLEAGIPIHDHRPIQHRDGKSPWCESCDLDADYRTPESRIPKITANTGLHFGKPDRPNLRRDI